jgi:hypothetical protein
MGPITKHCTITGFLAFVLVGCLGIESGDHKSESKAHLFLANIPGVTTTPFATTLPKRR